MIANIKYSTLKYYHIGASKKAIFGSKYVKFSLSFVPILIIISTASTESKENTWKIYKIFKVLYISYSMETVFSIFSLEVQIFATIIHTFNYILNSSSQTYRFAMYIFSLHFAIYYKNRLFNYYHLKFSLFSTYKCTCTESISYICL